MFTAEILQVVIPALAGLFGAIATYFVTNSNNKKDVTLNDRKSLSEDEKQFRQNLMDTINSYKSDLDDSRAEIRSLSEEITKLHMINVELTQDNKSLQEKVEELSRNIHEYRLQDLTNAK